MLEIGTKDMVTVLGAVDDGGIATHPAIHDTGAEDCGDLVAGQPPQTEPAAALEQFVDGKCRLKMKLRQYLRSGRSRRSATG